MTNRVEILKHKFKNSMGLPFKDLIGKDFVEKILEEQGVLYRNTLYNPVVTIWAWLSQVLDADKSLRNTVGRVIHWLSESNVELPSTDTGAYAKSRQRLPNEVLEQILLQSSQQLEDLVPSALYWCGHRLKAFDGTTVSMSDTLANQKSYPQPNTQKPGCGFPLVKLVVWFCVVTGAVIAVALAPYLISEWELSRELYSLLELGDVVVADSAYGTFVDLALVKQYQADGVFRKHHARHTDFRRGKKLGVGDHIVTWQRPAKCPNSMPTEDFESLPEYIEVREVHLSILKLGFRPKEIILVTTLLDPKRYTKAKLAELYGLRWSSTEVNLRHIKTTLKMEHIATKTPEMVRKDIWMHLLAYNLLRTVMIEAVRPTKLTPLHLSLQGTRQHFNHFKASLAKAGADDIRRLYEALLSIVYCEWLPSRPDRVEPRVLKRRPKAFPRMQHPRSTLKARLVR
jgi:Transposase DDE domain